MEPRPIARPILVIAAETIAARSGGRETVVDVLHGRAVRAQAEGLRHYLALLCGDATLARRALKEVRAQAAAEPAEALVAPPGLRARLYGLARAAAERARPAVADRPPVPPWRARDEDGGSPAARLRSELDPATRELLVLRVLRSLTPEEAGHVLGMEPGEVARATDVAIQRVRALLGDTDRRVVDALEEALAISTGETGALDQDPADPWDPLEPGTRIGDRYEIDARVGSGACADVYRARDTQVPGHVVALKLLHQASRTAEARDAAIRELRLIASVFHPSVVQFKDHGWHEERLWFVMPWYDGETLEARIRRGPLSRAAARQVFEPLARALAAMHAVGVRHQDVKPSNIFLARIPGFGRSADDEQLLPVLLDLGVAAKEAEIVVAGTPSYFAPEVAAQFAAGDARKGPGPSSASDVFSLALALRNALEPETEEVPDEGIEAFIERRARTMPPLPEGRELAYLEPLFRRWLSLTPTERPTAREFGAALAALTRPEERRRRRIGVARWVAPVAIGAVAGFGSVVLALQQEAHSARALAEEAQRSLSAANLEREELTRRVGELRDSYESSTLTRRELAAELAEAQGRASVLDRDLTARTRQAAEATGRVQELQAEAARLDAELSRARGDLASSRATLARLASDLETATGDLDTARQTLAETTAAAATLRSQLVAERAKSVVLENELAAAVQGRGAAEQALDALRRELAGREPELARGARHRGERDEPGTTAAAELLAP